MLLDAIASLQTGAAFSEPAAELTAKIEVVASAERRQLTVMFCDLVGSTALSARLDPEDLREIIAGYHRCCKGLVEHTGGFVAKYMGDREVGQATSLVYALFHTSQAQIFSGDHMLASEADELTELAEEKRICFGRPRDAMPRLRAGPIRQSFERSTDPHVRSNGT